MPPHSQPDTLGKSVARDCEYNNKHSPFKKRKGVDLHSTRSAIVSIQGVMISIQGVLVSIQGVVIPTQGVLVSIQGVMLPI